ncbi:MAG: hypothetical protein HYU78_02190 [Rhodocyclales bacterium]|nr:hypothetical protein [Rhodocyclales bacterium]
MAEPTSTTGFLLGLSSTFGITVFGVATGLHPAILLAGFSGGLWYLSIEQPAGALARVLFLGGSSLVAGYLAPVIAALVAAAAAKTVPFWPADITRDVLQFPVAFCVGFLGLRWIGPALLRRAQKAEEQL